MSEQRPADRKAGVLQNIGSVLAAFLGVQSNRNRQRDFAKGKASTFIVIGLVMTVIFVLVLYFVVQAVIASATA